MNPSTTSSFFHRSKQSAKLAITIGACAVATSSLLAAKPRSGAGKDPARNIAHAVMVLDSNQDHKLSLSELSHASGLAFDLLDANENGYLTFKEALNSGQKLKESHRESRQAERLSKADQNQDGSLSYSEFSSAADHKAGERKATKHRKGSRGNRNNRQNNANRPAADINKVAIKLSRILQTLGHKKVKPDTKMMFSYLDADGNRQLDNTELQRPNKKLAKSMVALDLNADGKVSRDEWLQPTEQTFARYDRNEDGELSKRELKKLAKHVSKQKPRSRSHRS